MMVTFLDNRPQSHRGHDGISDGISDIHRQILELIAANPRIIVQEITETLNVSRSISRSSVERALRHLKGEGMISRSGSLKRGSWVLMTK